MYKKHGSDRHFIIKHSIAQLSTFTSIMKHINKQLLLHKSEGRMQADGMYEQSDDENICTRKKKSQKNGKSTL
jgi:hypothetical protein